MTRTQWLFCLAAAVLAFAVGGSVAICRQIGELEARVTALEETEQEPPAGEDVQVSTYYNVPLSHYLQDYTMEVCDEYGLDPALAIAVMYVESRYQVDADSGAAYGLMQISGVVADSYGVNVTEPRNNIRLGCWLLATYCHQYEDTHRALMAYNMGQGAAAEAWEAGVRSTDYSAEVLDKAAEIGAAGRTER